MIALAEPARLGDLEVSPCGFDPTAISAKLLRASHVLRHPAASAAEMLTLLVRVHGGDEFEIEGKA